MMRDAAAAARGQFVLRYFVVTLALFAVPKVAVGNAAGELALTAAVFSVLVGIFLSRPAAFLSCLFAAVASGGIELHLGATTPKLFFAVVTVAAYVVSVLVRKALGGRVSGAQGTSAESGPRKASGLVVLALLYLVLLSPSLVQMLLPQRSLYLLTMRAAVLIGVLLFAREQRVPLTRAPVLLAASLLGSVIAAGYVVEAITVYRATSFTELAAGLALKDNTVQLGILGTTNTIASFLAVTLPLAVAHLLSVDRSTWERPFAMASVAVQSFGLLGTFSRGGAVAVLLGVALAALLCHTSVRQLRRLLGLVALAVSIVVVAGLLAQDAMRESFASRFALSTMNEYWLGRLELWYSSWRAFLQNPVFGIGVGNVGFFDRDFGSGHGSETHNLLLQTLAEEGLFAAALLFGVLFLILLRNVRAAKVGDNTQLWIVIALFSALINAMIEPTFWQPAFSALFWFSSVLFYRQAGERVREARAVSAGRRRAVRGYLGEMRPAAPLAP